MDLSIALLLAQDGVVSGAIYALLALALVLVFAVTRVVFIPQGEFVAYGALTLASFQMGRIPATLWLFLALAAVIAVLDGPAAIRQGRRQALAHFVSHLFYPAAIASAVLWGRPEEWPLLLQSSLTLALVAPLGPQLYRLVFQPVAEASVLVLLIVAVALHLSLVGLGLVFFGAEGSRTPPFAEGSWQVGALTLSGQSLWVLAASAALMFALYLFFEKTLYGKALRATAMNRVGARLMGISTTFAGKTAFFFAAAIGAASGILIAPITTIYYDTGFLIGLKGFVGAIIGGLASYPVAAAGALLVGLLESFSSFWASAYKEVLVFTLIIPVLVWRSWQSRQVEDAE